MSDEIKEEYQELIADLEEHGFSEERIEDIVQLKVDLAESTDKWEIRKTVIIKDIVAWNEALMFKTEKQIYSFYNTLGFDTRYRVMQDFCRFPTDNGLQYFHCLAGSERYDRNWVNSKGCSTAALELYLLKQENYNSQNDVIDDTAKKGTFMKKCYKNNATGDLGLDKLSDEAILAGN